MIKKVKIAQTLLCLLFIIGGPCFKSRAYILKPEMILKRLDKNQGAKNYKISQKILFLDRSGLDEVFRLKETWWKYSNRAYLQVTSTDHPHLKLNFIYQKFHKAWISGKTKNPKNKTLLNLIFSGKICVPHG